MHARRGLLAEGTEVWKQDRAGTNPHNDHCPKPSGVLSPKWGQTGLQSWLGHITAGRACGHGDPPPDTGKVYACQHKGPPNPDSQWINRNTRAWTLLAPCGVPQLPEKAPKAHRRRARHRVSEGEP